MKGFDVIGCGQCHMIIYHAPDYKLIKAHIKEYKMNSICCYLWNNYNEC